MSLRDELRRVLGAQPGRHMGYYDVMEAVFPHATNERAYRCASQGGPPGCAMALGKALRELGCYTTGQGGDRVVYLPPEDPGPPMRGGER